MFTLGVPFVTWVIPVEYHHVHHSRTLHSKPSHVSIVGVSYRGKRNFLFSKNVQTCSGAKEASYSMGVGILSQG
jgi:hypothetical protein